MSMFGKEIGSTSENLVLATAGKIKIHFGKKYIDILDNNGNLNVKIPKILQSANSLDEITKDGLYIVDGNFYIYYDGNLIQVTDKDAVEDYIKYNTEQFLTQEQISIAQKNIGLRFDSVDDALRNIDKGFVFIGDKIYYISGGSATETGQLNEPLQSINTIGPPTLDNVVILYKGGSWKYSTIFGQKDLDQLKEEIYSRLEEQQQDKNVIITDPIQYSEVVNIKSLEWENSNPCLGAKVDTVQDLSSDNIYILSISGSYYTKVITVDEETGEDIIDFIPSEINIIKETYQRYYQDYLDENGNFNPEYLYEEFDSEDLEYTISGDFVLVSIQKEIIKSNTIIFTFIYKDGFLYFIDENGSQITYNIETSDEGKFFLISDNKYFNGQISKNLYVKASDTNPNKFKIDYQNAEIALEENYTDSINPRTVLGDLDNTSKYYDIESFRTYKNKNWNRGLYSDQPVFSGAEFREPLKEEISGVQDYPRYSKKLNEELCNSDESEDFEDVIPTIRWIKQAYNGGTFNPKTLIVEDSTGTQLGTYDTTTDVTITVQNYDNEINTLQEQYNSLSTTVQILMERLKECCPEEVEPQTRWVSSDTICDNFNKYQQEKEQLSVDGGSTWQDTGSTRRGILLEENSEDCGYVTPKIEGDYGTIVANTHIAIQGPFTMDGGSDGILTINNAIIYANINNSNIITLYISGTIGPFNEPQVCDYNKINKTIEYKQGTYNTQQDGYNALAGYVQQITSKLQEWNYNIEFMSDPDDSLSVIEGSTVQYNDITMTIP